MEPVTPLVITSAPLKTEAQGWEGHSPPSSATAPSKAILIHTVEIQITCFQ